MPSSRSAPEPLPLDDALIGVTLLTVREAAGLFSCSRQTMYSLIGRGAIGVVRLGADLRVPATELEAWIARHLAAQNGRRPDEMRAALIEAVRRRRGTPMPPQARHG